jgi:CRP/FNR family transcriptional regulator, cyclic AMP receptor protein
MDPALRPQAKEFLLGIPVFGGLPDATMDRLLDMMQLRGLRPGENVCCEGELGREMFVVRAGVVEVKKRARDNGRETILAQLKAGDCVGEMSVIDVQPRSATVFAREPTELYVLNNVDLYTLYETDLPGYTFLVQNICRELSRRLRRADAIIADFFLRLEQYVVRTVD